MQVKCPCTHTLVMAQRKAVKVHESIPAFIIGLPEDLFEADIAKSKFAHTITFLKKIVPDLEEARCRMKKVHGTAKKGRYEVDVSITTPHKRYTYSNSGWDLAQIFDEMSESLKKRFAQQKRPKNKRSARQASDD